MIFVLDGCVIKCCLNDWKIFLFVLLILLERVLKIFFVWEFNFCNFNFIWDNFFWRFFFELFKWCIKVFKWWVIFFNMVFNYLKMNRVCKWIYIFGFFKFLVLCIDIYKNLDLSNCFSIVVFFKMNDVIENFVFFFIFICK